MKDIKVIDTLKKFEAEESRMGHNSKLPFHPLAFFASTLGIVREKETLVSIEEIAKCFRAQFEEEELLALIYQLNKGKL